MFPVVVITKKEVFCRCRVLQWSSLKSKSEPRKRTAPPGQSCRDLIVATDNTTIPSQHQFSKAVSAITTPTVTPAAVTMEHGDAIMANWNGMVDDDLAKTISKTFDLPPAEHDNYVYRADNFAMTMAQIQEQLRSGKLQYKYMAHGEPIEAG
jgi:hypothetical protein